MPSLDLRASTVCLALAGACAVVEPVTFLGPAGHIVTAGLYEFVSTKISLLARRLPSADPVEVFSHGRKRHPSVDDVRRILTEVEVNTGFHPSRGIRENIVTRLGARSQIADHHGLGTSRSPS